LIFCDGMRILVVEDDPRISSFVENGLQQNGHAVQVARDGATAWNIAQEETFDAAVVDLMLPKLDGFTLIERIREKGIAMPIIVLSAKRSVDDKVRCLRRGADDYLQKPFSRVAKRDGQRIELQPREFALLELLMRNRGRTLTKSHLLERLWDYNFDPQTNVVDVLVCRLRSKLDRDQGPKLIHTLRGVGYVFRPE
jgi:two-component system OmpR family response regulator